MLSLNAVIICKSKTWIHDSLTSVPSAESFSWLLSISVTHSCLPHLLNSKALAKVACGSSLPFHNRRSSRNEEQSWIPKSQMPSTEPRLKSSFPCLGCQPLGRKVIQHVLQYPPRFCVCVYVLKEQVARMNGLLERNRNFCTDWGMVLQREIDGSFQN